jgi:hypothetical protein
VPILLEKSFCIRDQKFSGHPIMLTAISTVLGMIPIAPTIFWGPMSYAIMGGLLAATVLTLIFLPALYLVWFRVKEPANDDQGQQRPARAAL